MPHKLGGTDYIITIALLLEYKLEWAYNDLEKAGQCLAEKRLNNLNKGKPE